MPMTVIVTRDVPPRTRGFLASVMLEVGPGVYTGSRMNHAVRERVWAVIEKWHAAEPRGCVVMTWADRTSVAGQQVMTLGVTPRELIEKDGLILAKRTVRPQ